LIASAGHCATPFASNTGSQQALDLLGKTLISPGDKVIVEGPTFLATIQCFRLYGAELITAPVDGHGVDTDALERLIAEHNPKFVYLIPTFGNPSGAMLSLERRQRVLEMAVKHNTLIVEDDPYGDLYFGEAPPPSLLALSASVPGSRDLLVHCGSCSAPAFAWAGWSALPNCWVKPPCASSSATPTPAPRPPLRSTSKPAACPPRSPKCALCMPNAPQPCATR